LFLSRYFTFLTECDTPKACTILLRGPSKDILNEIDRNLADAMSVARNVVFNPMLAPGGGATEMAVSVGLQAKARTVLGVEGWPYSAVADAMEVIPRTLVQNSGGNAIRVLTELRVSDSFISSSLVDPVVVSITYSRSFRQNMPMANTRGELTERLVKSST
jgi:chaperonin GroEL (HSP60 family)